MGEALEMVHIGRSLSSTSTPNKGQSERQNNLRKYFSVQSLRKHIHMCSCFSTRSSPDIMREAPLPQTQKWEISPSIKEKPTPKKETIAETKTKDNGRVSRTLNYSIRDYDACYKILMIGDSGVGKTTILRCLQGKEFSAKSFTTVGMDFVSKILDVDGAKIKLEIWDTAGQERFRSMTRFQFRGAKGALLVYDVTDRESYKTLSYWLKMVDMEIDQHSKESIPVMLLGNKADKTDMKQVPFKKGFQLSEENLMLGFRETSAKTGKDVLESVTALAQAVTEINNPKLLDSYLCPFERAEKQQMREFEAQKIQEYYMRKRRSRISLKSLSRRRKSVEHFNKCCKT